MTAPSGGHTSESRNAMAIVGNILSVLGCLVSLAGGVMFLNVAYRRSFCWFFGCLFVPWGAEAFLLTHWRAAWKPFTLSLVGVGVAILGVLITERPPT